jgi:hypothetical protein
MSHENSVTDKCSCGAFTYTTDQGSWSMKKKDYNRLIGRIPNKKGYTYNCNYCVNKWGIDLCNCGSGKKVGKCKETYECRHNIPAQEFNVTKEYALWN